MAGIVYKWSEDLDRLHAELVSWWRLSPTSFFFKNTAVQEKNSDKQLLLVEACAIVTGPQLAEL